MIASRASDERSVVRSLREYGRGIAGGLLFSLPLLYTMEMWWTGYVVSPPRQLVYIGATFILLLGYNRYAGLRADSGWTEVAIDSVEEMGLGLALAAAVLLLMGRLSGAHEPAEVIGQIVVEGMTVAIGVSVGTAQLGGGENGDDEPRGMSDDDDESVTFGGQVVIGFCGAVLFAANIAPTDEITVIAAEASVGQLIGMAAAAATMGGLILYFSHFRGSRRFARVRSGAAIAAGTIVTYAIALVSSAAVLWFFGRFDGAATDFVLAQTVVLGNAATLGASAGRLLLQ